MIARCSHLSSNGAKNICFVEFMAYIDYSSTVTGVMVVHMHGVGKLMKYQ